ncbi:uncharacterized protein LOC131215612 [Anopheles bellator]|uniref:uncharacterized protein LOC131215612 n=1 Tax=Anopheles bellator TaxID=139047 RepID=UPI0026480314|nr:uncharacterized protein LOC131215612 [Anopheles bellator]
MIKILFLLLGAVYLMEAVPLDGVAGGQKRLLSVTDSAVIDQQPAAELETDLEVAESAHHHKFRGGYRHHGRGYGGYGGGYGFHKFGGGGFGYPGGGFGGGHGFGGGGFGVGGGFVIAGGFVAGGGGFIGKKR